MVILASSSESVDNEGGFNFAVDNDDDDDDDEEEDEEEEDEEGDDKDEEDECTVLVTFCSSGFCCLSEENHRFIDECSTDMPGLQFS